jgi:glycosyltransferase involved in cell wall biosynthesis
MEKNIFVIIPIFNEEENIKKLFNVIKKLKLEYELNFLLIDDGSEDNSPELIQKYFNDNNHYLYFNNKNYGLGYTVRKGISIANEKGADIIVKIDADLQHNFSQINDVLSPILNSNYDLVYGDRFSGGLKYKMPRLRKIGNVFFTKLVRFLTKYDINDSQPGFFAINSSVAKSLKIPGNYNVTQQILIESSINDFKFASKPIDFYRREGGKSFISFFYPLKVFTQILFIYFIIKPLQTFGKIGCFLMLSAIFIGVYQISDYLFGDASRPISNVNLVSTLFLFGFNMLAIGILGSMINARK